MRLSTGKEVGDYSDIIGIDSELDVFGGYDFAIDAREYCGEDLTREERIELADRMIVLWKRYRERSKR